ncbi:hypothetical protein KKG85_02685, partial [Patescibacteria group bacterium]|nr:hypothetical protein [Patescibacteria group bacterium]
LVELMIFVAIIGISSAIIIPIFFNDTNDKIVSKIIVQESLTNNEQDRYKKNKEEIDNIVKDQMIGIARKIIAKADLSDQEKKAYNLRQKHLDQIVIEESKRFSKEGKMAYRRINGGLGIFDTSGVCKKFGFRSGDRILTKWGEATVIGILEGDDKLWFHIDGKKGASFWSEIREKDFKLIKSAERNAKQENKSSLESRATDTVNTTKDNNIESVGSLEKDVYLLGEMIPLIQPITN